MTEPKITEHRKDLERYRDELIQTAAVCAAIAEDLEFGIAEFDRKIERGPWGEPLSQGEIILGRIRHERRRQDGKWGPQSHSPQIWLAILSEEVGEAAEEIDFFGEELDLFGEGGAAYVAKLVLDVRLIGRDAREILEELFA